MKYAKATKTYGLKYVKLDLESSRIFLFTDALFGNALEGSSQITLNIAMVDESNNTSIFALWK